VRLVLKCLEEVLRNSQSTQDLETSIAQGTGTYPCPGAAPYQAGSLHSPEGDCILELQPTVSYVRRRVDVILTTVIVHIVMTVRADRSPGWLSGSAVGCRVCRIAQEAEVKFIDDGARASEMPSVGKF